VELEDTTAGTPHNLSDTHYHPLKILRSTTLKIGFSGTELYEEIARKACMPNEAFTADWQWRNVFKLFWELCIGK